MRLRWNVAMVLAAVLSLTVIITSPRTRDPVDAQDRTDERLSAVETEVAEHATVIASLRRRVRRLEATATAASQAASTPLATQGPSPTPRPTQGASGPVGSFTNPVPLGDSADVGGGWSLRVINVIPDATEQVMAENQFNEPPAEGRQFFLITVSLTNGSDTPASPLTVVGFSAVGVSAVAYQPFEDSCGVIPNELSIAEVFPGGTTEGNICFSVRSDDVDSLILYTDSYITFDRDDRVYFSLRKP